MTDSKRISLADLKAEAIRQLRAKRDEELARERPHPLITVASFSERVRGCRWPMAALCGITLIVLCAVILPLAAIAHTHLWVGLFIPIVVLAWAVFMDWDYGRMSRRYGVACPYCGKSLLREWDRRSEEGRENTFGTGRCPWCQRMVVQIETLDQLRAEVDDSISKGKCEKLDPDEL